MFDDDDRVLHRLEEVCLGLPGADRKTSHGRPAFFTKKIFAIYGAVVKGNHDPAAHDRALVFLPDAEDVIAFEQDQRFFVPAYWGPYGWMAIDLDVDRTDWDEVAELVEESFRGTAPKKLVQQLEQRR